LNALTCVQTALATTWSVTCKTGYYLLKGVCTTYGNCATVAITSQYRTKVACTSCIAGYYLTAAHTCITCGAGVATCDVYNSKPWITSCTTASGFTAGSFTFTTNALVWPTCASAASSTTKATGSVYMTVSYIAMLVLLFVAMF
jgi:hypothetical protein